jgi:hypothetical protein
MQIVIYFLYLNEKNIITTTEFKFNRLFFFFLFALALRAEIDFDLSLCVVNNTCHGQSCLLFQAIIH